MDGERATTMDSERPHPHAVSVELSGCSKDDARVVFDTLCACFSSDRRADDVPQELDEVRPTVWLGTFDVGDARAGAARPGRLRAPVEADVQGGCWAVDRFRSTLDDLFTVSDLCTASGDQERELHLRLESR
jgi:hypothetical protein